MRFTEQEDDAVDLMLKRQAERTDRNEDEWKPEPRQLVTVMDNAKQHVADMIRMGSIEQKHVWSLMKNWKAGHVIVEAVAGSGKSFVIQYGVMQLGTLPKVLICAFNVHIEEAMNKALKQIGAPRNIECRTFNSIGYEALRKKFPDIKLRKNKLMYHVNELIPTARWATKESVMRLSSLCKSNLINWEPDDGGYDAIEAVASRYSIDLGKTSKSKHHIIQTVMQTLEACINDTSGCDYDDQTWMPLLLNLDFPWWSMVCVDEFQDMDYRQWALIKRLAFRPDGKDSRIVATGDKRQSCYGFRGAATDVMDQIECDLNLSTKDLHIAPLTYTRRCTRVQVRAARAIVPQIQHLPDAPEGFIGTSSHDQFQAMVRTTDLVMCRTNAPLVEAALSIAAMGKKVVVRGREIGDACLNLLSFLGAGSIQQLSSLLDEWYAREKARLNFRTQKDKVLAVEDRYLTIKAFIPYSTSVNNLCQRIKDLFAKFEPDGRPKDAIVFCTIHKAKGLEAPVCHILAPELIPHPRVTQIWEIEQELNLAYIAITRAKFHGKNPDTGKTYFVGGAVPLVYGNWRKDSEPHNSIDT